MSDRPDAKPPFFFRRVWSGGTDMDEGTLFTRGDDGTYQIVLGVPMRDMPTDAVTVGDDITDGLVIYGRAIWPDDRHDRKYVARMKRQGQVFAECFSTDCDWGEVGCHPLAAVTEISREEFEAARERGWAGE